MKKLLVLFTAIVLLTLGCEQPPEFDVALLYGNWKGTVIETNGTPTMVADGALNFKFHDNGIYSFKGGNNTEKGSYHVAGKLLVTQDSTAANALAKQVEVELITADSLILNMNDAGTPTKMVFVKH